MHTDYDGIFIVAPKEVAKCTGHYGVEPEKILACIIVSGCKDTASILRTEILTQHGANISSQQKAAHDLFKRILTNPTLEEAAAVEDWVVKIKTMATKKAHGKP